MSRTDPLPERSLSSDVIEDSGDLAGGDTAGPGAERNPHAGAGRTEASRIAYNKTKYHVNAFTAKEKHDVDEPGRGSDAATSSSIEQMRRNEKDNQYRIGRRR